MTDGDGDSGGGVRLVGDRLILREFTAADERAVQAYAGDRVVTRFLEWGPNSIRDTRDFLSKAMAQAVNPVRSEFSLAVVHAASGRVIGAAALMIDAERRHGVIGYALHREFWYRGYATEAAGSLVQFGFGRLDLCRLSATCHPDNRASARVLTKVGLQYQGRIRNHLYVKGAWRDALLYAVTNPVL